MKDQKPNQGVASGIGWRYPHYRELLERKPQLDFLEVHSENFFADGGAALAVLMQGRAHYPVSLHGVGLSLGSAMGLDEWHLVQLAHLVERVEPVRVSDHACFARVQVQGTPQSRGWGQSIHASDLLPIPFSPEALDVICTNVQQVQDRLKRTILVENLSAYMGWKNADDEVALSEPQFLNALARRSGCQLLVDVNNIYVNALNARLAVPAESTAEPLSQCVAWLRAIVPEHVGELHVAGHCHVNDEHGQIFIDDHGSRVCNEVWQLHAFALQRFGAVPTLVEWDTAVPALDVLLAEAAMARSARMCDAGTAPNALGEVLT